MGDRLPELGVGNPQWLRVAVRDSKRYLATFRGATESVSQLGVWRQAAVTAFLSR